MEIIDTLDPTMNPQEYNKFVDIIITMKSKKDHYSTFADKN